MKILSILAAFALVIFTVIGIFISYANTAVTMEETINRFHQNSQNTLSSYTLKVKEAAQIPDMYTDKLKEIIQATFEGRYGENGSQATFQWIQEQNLQVDSSLYSNLQTIISSGRDEFKLSQDRKIEGCTTYQTMLRKPVSGTIMRIMGYPGIDLGICKIVLDVNTISTFETGIATEIKLR
jgi:hypothetical protein